MVAITHVANPASHDYAARASVVIVGAGAAGLTAALSAVDAGSNVLVLERDSHPSGSTALSAGLIPAPATRWQQSAGITDSVDQFVDDILSKSGCESDRPLAQLAASQITATLHWLADTHAIELSLVDGFTYPGHSVRRMHGTMRRTGRELMDALLHAVDQQSKIDLLCDAYVDTLHVDSVEPDQPATITGIEYARPDGQRESVAVKNLVLASNGYGGNAELVATLIPSMSKASYFGHPGNTGDALLWGQALQAATGHLGAFQGHGSVAKPHGILISWAVMMRGGIQINVLGERFSNEHAGYSEQAAIVARQPQRKAFNIYDQRVHESVVQFQDYRDALDAGAIHLMATSEDLAEFVGTSVDNVERTLRDVDLMCKTDGTDVFGRHFDAQQRLQPPYYAVCVEGALFHTQGGLCVNAHCQVLHSCGDPFANLYAVGGAALGVSGDSDRGYLSGNGLLTAVALGAIAGRAVVSN